MKKSIFGLLLMALMIFSLLPMTTASAADEPDRVQLWENGPYFATTNLGAANPEDFGDYYAWGETSSYYSSLSPLAWKTGKEGGYAWNSYCGQGSFTEWSTPPYDATTKRLKPGFDAATGALGNEWRTPTREEYGMLLNPSYCTATWTDNYNNTGVSGLIVQGNKEGYTDKSIFLPATGSSSQTQFWYQGSQGYYWSADLYNDVPMYANLFYAASAGNGILQSTRYCGYAVRAVSDVPPAEPHIHGTGTAAVTFDKAIKTFDDLKALFTNGGKGYLAADIKCTEDLTLAKDVDLCLNDKVLNLNKKHIAVGTVSEGQQFNLYDCGKTVRYYDKATASDSWTLITTGGTSDLTTTGGVITGGGGIGGGGVDVYGKFTMNGGTIVGNKASNGGGVSVWGTFTMNGGMIVGNSLYSSGSGGGGVYLNGNATFTMTGNSIISDNEGKSGAGVYCFTNSAFTVSGNSQITGNTASSFGGGVYVGGTFTMSENSRIADNISKNTGGGVYINGTGNFIMIGGSVDHNTASANGGGVYDAGAITLGGAAKITDNTYATKTTSQTQNLHMGSKKIITLGTGTGEKDNGIPEPTNDLSVGVTLMSKTGIFTATGNADYSALFTADAGADYKVINLANDGNVLKVVTHYDVTVDPAIVNGKVITDAADNKAFEGDTVILTVTPDSGYQLKADSLKAQYNDGEEKTITPVQDAQDITKYTFIMPGYAVTVTAEFEEAPHIHHPVKVAGQPAAVEVPGFKDYYECKDSDDACGALFEDEDGTVPINDLAAWKAEGGNGYIPPLPKTAVELTGISVTKAPDKTAYTEGEAFDDAGMTVTAAYSDGSSKAVTDYTITPSGALSVTDTAVEISYTENGVTKTASLTIQVEPAGPVEYKIISGGNQTVSTNVKSAKFVSNADFSKFDHVEVDGKTVAKKYYTAQSGSTEITFNEDFIKTLSVGKHTMTIVSKDGSAKTSFNVADLPKTGDSSTPFLWLGMCMLAIFSVLTLRKKAYKN